MASSRLILTLSVLVLLLPTQLTAAGVDAPGNESAWNVAEESYQRGEFQRRQAVLSQYQLNQRLAWSAGYAPGPIGGNELWSWPGGDIWGYKSHFPWPEPLAYESVQTGPNRWEYRPLYAGPPQKDARPFPKPELIQPRLMPPVPAGNTPAPLSVPGNAPSFAPGPNGAREF